MLSTGVNPLLPDAGSAVTGLVLMATFAFIFLYVLYGVIRAGVAAGIARAVERGHLPRPASSIQSSDEGTVE